MRKLQNEMAASVLELMRSSAEPMDMADIIAAYPDNEIKKKCSSENELKHYIAIGLGKLIQDGSVKELPKTADGRYPLEVVSDQ